MLTNEKTGLSAFLSANLGPIFSGMDLIVFAIVLLIVLMLLSNVCNSLVVGMILQPIILLYCQTNGVEAAALVTISTFFVLSCAMFTPSASPFAAMLFSNRKGWRGGCEAVDHREPDVAAVDGFRRQIGRASCRERV